MPIACQLSRPRDFQGFEHACRVLWQCILKDPTVQLVGRSGQFQKGVDLFGYRDRDIDSLVGVQCKLKQEGKLLTAAEINDSVENALLFEPALREFFIVTTAPDDADHQELARKLSLETARSGRSLTVHVWGWGTLQQHILEHPEATNAFDPTYGPHAQELLASFATLANLIKDSAGTSMSLRSDRVEYRLPTLPEPYFPPTEELRQIRPLILEGDGPAVGIANRTAGLFGMGGIGKTVLASSLVRDPEVVASFPAGIIWLTFGSEANVLAKQGELAFVLIDSATSHAVFENLHHGNGVLQRLSQQLKSRLLVVLDDVWDPERARIAFGGLDPKLKLLVTTRDKRVLEAVDARVHSVGLLDEGASLEFLAASVGIDLGRLPIESGEIARRCHGLRLALTAVATLIRRGTHDWSEVLDALRNARLHELPARWRDDPDQRDVAAVLKVSIDALPEGHRTCLADFAVLREDALVPEEALANLWRVQVGSAASARTIARDIADRSLLMRETTGHYRIHDLYREFLRDLVGATVRQHQGLLSRYKAFCPRSWAEGPNDGYFFEWLAWHLTETGDLTEILFSPEWIHRKCELLGGGALIEDYSYRPNDNEANLVTAALRLSLTNLARSPTQLEAQLCGRLTDPSGKSIAALLKALRRQLPTDCLIPLDDGFLDRPGQLARILRSHTGFVNAIAVSANGRSVVSGSEDGFAILWNADTGAVVRTFGPHDAGVNAVAIVEPLGRLVCACEDGTITVWDLKTAEPLMRSPRPGGSADLLVSLSDHWRVASASSGGGLEIWNIAALQRIGAFGQGHRISSLVSMPNGWLLTGTLDGDVIAWDSITGERIRAFGQLTGIVRAIIPSQDGASLLVVASDGTARAWALVDGKELRQLYVVPVDGGSGTIAGLPRSGIAMSGMVDGKLRFWSTQDGRPQAIVEAHGDIVSAVAVVEGRNQVISGSHDATVRIWDLSAPVAERPALSCGSSIYSLDVSTDGSLALSGSEDGTVRLWDLSERILKDYFSGHSGPVRSVTFLDGSRAISGAQAGDIKIHELSGGAPSRTILTGRGLIHGIVSIGDEQVLFGGGPGTIDLLDLKTERVFAGAQGHSQSITTLAVTSDRQRIISGAGDHEIRLWDVATRSLICKFKGHAGTVYSIEMLPGGEEFLSGSADGELRRWDIATQQTTRTLMKDRLGSVSQDGRRPAVLCVRALPGARLAAVCCSDNTLRIWDLEDDREVKCFVDDHLVGVSAVSGDGAWLLSGNTGGRLHRFRCPVT